MGCNNKLGDTCGKKTNALCVKYEGTLSDNSALSPCDCLNVEIVIEDQNAQLNKISSEIDLTDLTDDCIDYNPVGATITVKEAVLKIDSKICEIVNFIGLDATTDCSTCIDPCADGTTTCNNGVVYYNFATGAFPLTVVGKWESGVTTTDQYSTNLTYTATKAGKYKYTVEISGTMGSASTAKVGISVNSIDPVETVDLAGFFSSKLITEEGSVNSTYTLLKDLNIGDSSAVNVKLASGAQFQVDNIKIVIEKVG